MRGDAARLMRCTTAAQREAAEGWGNAVTIDRIKDINVFVHVAETKSFTIAAEQVGLSRSAVGKSVTRLEDRLGVRLLQRTTRSVSLTSEGAAFNERCVRILADLDEAEHAMLSHAQAPRGVLRLELPVSFGRLHVLPIVSQFMDKWPELVVTVSLSDRYVDLIDEGIDLAIRLGGSDDSRLMTRLLAPHRLVTCASPAYLERYGIPRDIDELGRYSCLRLSMAEDPSNGGLRLMGRRARSRSAAASAQPMQRRSGMRRLPDTASRDWRSFLFRMIFGPAASSQSLSR